MTTTERHVDALAAEHRRLDDEITRLYVRRGYVKDALLRARQGVSEGEVRAMLEARNIIILCRPAVPAGGAS